MTPADARGFDDADWVKPDGPHGTRRLALSSDDDQRVSDPVTTLMVKEGSFMLLRSPAKG